MFIVRNLRTGDIQHMSSEELQEKIIQETNGIHEDLPVLPERTGLRLESLDDLFNELTDFIIHKGIYLVTALSRINPNRLTRYMVLIDGE